MRERINGFGKSLGPKGLLMQTASFLSFSYFFPLGGLDFRRREEKQSFLDSGEGPYSIAAF